MEEFYQKISELKNTITASEIRCIQLLEQINLSDEDWNFMFALLSDRNDAKKILETLMEILTINEENKKSKFIPTNIIHLDNEPHDNYTTNNPIIQKASSKEITEHVMEFIEWMLAYKNHDWDWGLDFKAEKVRHFLNDKEVTFEEVYQYWLNNIHNK